MNISVFSNNGSVYTDCECLNGYAFNIAVAGNKCVLLPVICDDSGLTRDNCAHFYRIECLLPHINTA